MAGAPAYAFDQWVAVNLKMSGNSLYCQTKENGEKLISNRSIAISVNLMENDH